MDMRLLRAAVSGATAEIKHLAVHDPGVLLGTTPPGNTCLHIAAMHGHERFCKSAPGLEASLLAAVNSVLLRCCRDRQLSKAILKQDKRGCNALHHAIRGGHRELALELIQAEPALARAVNQYEESPMFIAVMRNYEDVLEKLLEIPDSATEGACGLNALHAAVRNGNSAITKKIMETRPALARQENKNKKSPMDLAVLWNKIEVLRVLLEHDRSLGYLVSSDGMPLLVTAANRGHVGVARELLKHCPDAPTRCTTTDRTCLHQALLISQQTKFVEFVLNSPQLRGLVNMRDSDGDTALHCAVQKCNPKIVTALLHHQDIDVTVIDKDGSAANWKLPTRHAKTLNWLILDKVTDSSRKDIKSLTQTYTGNTSLVAILIATITFAAAFTLPGGYSADAGNEGLPIMTRKLAFKAFLIFDTLAMCSSLAIAFICVLARWEDLEFLRYYMSYTKKLMWFAYMATTTAFATGLYTVLAPHLLWLAVVVCILTSLLPILTKLLGEWLVLKLRFRLGKTFKSELLDMV